MSLSDTMNALSISRMVITDLDGTLLHSDRTLSQTNLATLEFLGRQRILRVIATGRSLYSARKVLPSSFPLDYLVFSSGAGILDWSTQEILIAHHLTSDEIQLATETLQEHQIDFMLHRPIPDNHYFAYYTTNRENPDFARRCQLYQNFASPLYHASPLLHKACQFVAILPQTRALPLYDTVKTRLSDLRVIRATSPLDGKSLWLEIFPRAVSKGLAGDWIAREHQIDRRAILALGNDYNDLELLEWAGSGFVVNNAPQELQSQYRTVRSNNDDGFSDAVKIWINY